jgi:hypothetical protein
MRTIFLVLLLANLLLCAWQFDVVRNLVWKPEHAPVPVQMNAERLRIVRDTSALPRAPAGAPAPSD